MLGSPRLLPLVVLLLLVTSCVRPYDPVTVADFRAMTSKESAAARCTAALARETAKPSPDKKTVRHLTEVCDCYARATDDIYAAACRSNIVTPEGEDGTYVLYETTKGGGAR